MSSSPSLSQDLTLAVSLDPHFNMDDTGTTWHCCLCDDIGKSVVHFRGHSGGRKHQLNLSNKAFFCRLCGISCGKEPVLQQHLLGRVHILKLALRIHGVERTRLKSGVASSLKTPASTSHPSSASSSVHATASSSSPSASSSGRKHRRRTARTSFKKSRVTVVPAPGSAAASSQSSQRPTPSRSRPGFCELCGVSCGSSENLFAHCAGRKHMKEVRRRERTESPQKSMASTVAAREELEAMPSTVCQPQPNRTKKFVRGRAQRKKENRSRRQMMKKKKTVHVTLNSLVQPNSDRPSWATIPKKKQWKPKMTRNPRNKPNQRRFQRGKQRQRPCHRTNCSAKCLPGQKYCLLCERKRHVCAGPGCMNRIFGHECKVCYLRRVDPAALQKCESEGCSRQVVRGLCRDCFAQVATPCPQCGRMCRQSHDFECGRCHYQRKSRLSRNAELRDRHENLLKKKPRRRRPRRVRSAGPKRKKKESATEAKRRKFQRVWIDVNARKRHRAAVFEFEDLAMEVPEFVNMDRFRKTTMRRGGK